MVALPLLCSSVLLLKSGSFERSNKEVYSALEKDAIQQDYDEI